MNEEKRRQLIERVQHVLPTEQLTEFNMDRWLESYGEDIDLCEKMVHDYLKNRKVLGFDEPNFFNGFYSKANIQKFCDIFPQSKIQKGWVNSYDNGIVFVEAGIAEPSKAAKFMRPGEYLSAFFGFLELMLQHVLEQEKLTNRRSWAVCIFDMQNVSILQWVNPLGPMNRSFEARVALAMAYYAEMLSKVVIVNPPYLLNVLFKIMSFILPKSISNRFHVATNFAEIQKWISPDAVPVGYGGQKIIKDSVLPTGYNPQRKFKDEDILKAGRIWEHHSISVVQHEHHTLKAGEIFARKFEAKKGQKLVYEYLANRNFVVRLQKENGDFLLPFFPKMCTPILPEEGAVQIDEHSLIKFELKNLSTIFSLKLRIAIKLID
ncbi:hypothetical protein niasHT_016224 [Heterodera trifolii]|uniref:CRAL-TRIO domain-containing protein n=1 Tax=Heterodera trifolii TaxID=157864 RepID=A0ABD2L5S8_9BILA